MREPNVFHECKKGGYCCYRCYKGFPPKLRNLVKRIRSKFVRKTFKERALDGNY